MRRLGHDTLLVVSALTVVGLIFRLVWVNSRLLADEVVTQRLAEAPWPDLWHYLQLENTPPLFFLIARAWTRLVPTTEFWSHLLPLLIGTATIPLAYLLARQALTRSAASIVTGLVAVSAPFVSESLEFRAYALTGLLAVLYLFTFLRWAEPGRGGVWPLVVLGTIGLYTHLQFGLLLVASTLVVLSDTELRRRWRSWALATVGPAAALTPWLVFVLANRGASIVGPAWWSGLSPSRISQFANWIGAFYPLWFNRGAGAALTGLGLAALVLLGVAAAIARRPRREVPLLIRLSGWLTLTGIAAGLLANVAVPKYFLVVFPGLFLLIAFAWQQLRPRKIAVALVGVFLATVLAVNASTKQRGDWLPGLAFLAEEVRSDAVIVAHPNLEAVVLEHYLPDETVVPMLPTRYWSDDRFADLLRYNFQRVITPETVGDLATMTAGSDEVWFVSTVVPRADFFNSDLPIEWFIGQGWHGRLIGDFAGDGLYLFRFRREPTEP